MSIVKIPVQKNQAAWVQRTRLDGVDYQLDFAWNGREGAWYVSISKVDGSPLVLGLKLVSNRPLLKRFRHVSGLPPGELAAINPEASIDYAQYGDLNNGVLVCYFDAATLANLGGV